MSDVHIIYIIFLYGCCIVGNRSSRPKVISPEVPMISPETTVMSPEILVNWVARNFNKEWLCNISRSLSDNETKQAGQLCN